MQLAAEGLPDWQSACQAGQRVKQIQVSGTVRGRKLSNQPENKRTENRGGLVWCSSPHPYS
ncbi:MAG: hypothetical protein MI923_24575 [Phycisphaerales bacterium]|nr:hypothetical protein [Phycisphaerales bacterium]